MRENIDVCRLAWSSRKQSIGVALQVFVANHLILGAISMLTGRLFYDVPGRAPHSLAALWQRWDVLWYIHLADRGYHWYPPPIQSNLAFFPLYPLSMHLLTVVSPLSAYAAGLLVANLCFAGALYLLHRLLTHDFDAGIAERGLFYIGLFPASIFFFTAYSEALFLLCIVGCFYALRLHHWWLAGLCGVAATLTRQLGLFLVIPFAIELYQYWPRQPRPWRGWHGSLVALALVPGSLLAFMGYLYLHFGDGLLFARAQLSWQRNLALPWQGAMLALDHLAYMPGRFSIYTRGALQALSLLDLLFLTLFLGLIFAGARRLPKSYTAFSCAVLLAILISPASGRGQPLALLSISRFEATLFPPFVVLAMLGKSRSADRMILAVFVSLLALFTILFVRGRWIA